MKQCNYCDRAYETDEALVDHLDQHHDRAELTTVDRRWVDRYAEATGETTPSPGESDDGVLDRRQLMALAGASTLGIAGMTVGIAEQNGPSLGDLPGLGTQNSPTEISTFDQLLTISDDLSADYVLVDDIDATGEDPIEPLDSDNLGFSGTLDGQGYEITGLEIETGLYTNEEGLFIELSGTIASLNLVDVTVTAGSDGAGGIAFRNLGTIRHCSVQGSVTGGGVSGGLVGRNESTIEECFADVTVDASGDNVGGLAGKNFGTIVDSYAIGDVQASEQTRVGGLLGQNGGLEKSGTVDRTYAAGQVAGSDPVGGLVGTTGALGNVSGSYWDVPATGYTSSDGGTGLGSLEDTPPATEMIGSDAEANMTAFDFDGPWQTVEAGDVLGDIVAEEDGYPILSNVDTLVQLNSQTVALSGLGSGVTVGADNATLTNVTVSGDGN